jgi:carbon monoxide dehydrogenase subunit G
MEMTNTRIVPAPPATVWEGLNDPETLKACIPGCESLERVTDDEWRAVVAIRIGPVSARFSGTMRMQDSTPPSGYTLKFEGQGGAAGFANGEAKVTLAPAANSQTELTYVAKAQVGGKLAQIGSRLVDGAAAKIADEFFARFTERMALAGAGASGAAEVTTPAPAPAPDVVPLRPASSLRTSRIVRYVAVVAILVVLGLLYARVIRF